MSQLSIQFVFIIVICFQSIMICMSDIRSRTISNKQVVYLLFSLSLLSYMEGFLINTIPYAFVLLVFGFLLFLVGVWGAGDAKLLFAYGLAIKPEVYSLTLLAGSSAVVIQVVATVFYHGGLKNANKVGVAFGVPIAVSGLLGVICSVLI